jgi:hypothetical protein
MDLGFAALTFSPLTLKIKSVGHFGPKNRKSSAAYAKPPFEKENPEHSLSFPAEKSPPILMNFCNLEVVYKDKTIWSRVL